MKRRAMLRLYNPGKLTLPDRLARCIHANACNRHFRLGLTDTYQTMISSTIVFVLLAVCGISNADVEIGIIPGGNLLGYNGTVQARILCR
jgi:hypothetical protein